MSTQTFPVLPGLSFPVERMPVWDTITQTAASGKEVRIAKQSAPRWQWTVSFAVLRSDAVNLELQQLAERVLERRALVREVAVAEAVQEQLVPAAAREQRVGARPRLIGARIVAAEHRPRHAQRGLRGEQREQRATAADLDVVGVGTDAQHVAQARSGVHEVERDHDRVSFASDGRSQTRHGGAPPATRSSSVCLSRNVSMHCQKHASR